MPENKFHSKTYGVVNLKEIALIIKKLLLENPDALFNIAVGCDSQTGYDSKIVQAITIHKVGHYGLFFYKSHRRKRFINLQEKLIAETQNSIEIATELLNELDNLFDQYNFNYLNYNLHLQVHCDVGTEGASSNYIKEVTGYVKSSLQDNYEIFIKPNSYAASFIADKVSKPDTKLKG